MILIRLGRERNEPPKAEVLGPCLKTLLLRTLRPKFNILKDNWGRWKQHSRTLIESFMARREPRVLTLEQSVEWWYVVLPHHRSWVLLTGWARSTLPFIPATLGR
ncbi:hypothetical protein TNCV_5112841 [Trichonephila clavipes]|nr:hypothetical protein TNCV_5112841 [Trichonephila clavipes]